MTVEEYEFRQAHYDKQLKENFQIDISKKSVADKVDLLRNYRERQYDKLQDAVYSHRGWTENGIPTLETIRRLGIDFPDVIEILKANNVT